MAVRIKNHLLGQLLNAGAITDDEILSMAEQIKRQDPEGIDGYYRPVFDSIPNITLNHGIGHVADLSKYYRGPKAVFKLQVWSQDHVKPTTSSYTTIYENGLLHIEPHLPVGNYSLDVKAISEYGIISFRFKIIIH